MTVVPGVTSAFAVPALAGIPVTHRGVAHEVVVVSGHLAPDDPESLVDWPALARLRGTVCVLMGLANLPAIAAALIGHGRDPDTPVAVVQDGTTAAQRTVRATPGRRSPPRSPRPASGRPRSIVVGAVVDTLGT